MRTMERGDEAVIEGEKRQKERKGYRRTKK